MAPKVEMRRCQLVPPSVAIVAAISFGGPAKAKAIANRLFGDSDVDGLVVNANHVELW